MLKFQIKNHKLERQFLEILSKQYKGDIDKLIEEFIKNQQNKEKQREKNLDLLKYKGILSDSTVDGLSIQNEIREEWN